MEDLDDKKQSTENDFEAESINDGHISETYSPLNTLKDNDDDADDEDDENIQSETAAEARFREQRLYSDNLIGKSDLLVTEEEARLFPIGENEQLPSIGMGFMAPEDTRDDAGDEEEKILVDELSKVGDAENSENISENNETDENGRRKLNPQDYLDLKLALTPLKEEVENDNELTPAQLRLKQIGNLLDQDDLWDTDCELDDDSEFKQTEANEPKLYYYQKCSQFSVVPVKYFAENIEKSRIVMRHHGLGGNGTKAVARSLQRNIHVEHLDLTGNGIDHNGGQALGAMIEENTIITSLILMGNIIESNGVKHIAQAMKINSTLRILNLSKNNIGDSACEHLAEMIESSKSLSELYLSENDIGNEGSALLGPAMASNDLLEVVDLSWNKIRGEGAVTLARGIRENIRIHNLNLSWNGFGSIDGGRALSEMIRDNVALKKLQLQGNRLDSEIIIQLGKALQSNEVLESLDIGYNPVRTAALSQFASTLSSNETSLIKEILLNDIPIDFETMKLFQQIETTRPDFRVITGPQLRIGNEVEDVKKQAIIYEDPIQKLNNDHRLVTLLSELDKEKSMSVSVGQFTQALNELEIPFKKSNIYDIQERLDRQNNGKIYYGDYLNSLEPLDTSENTQSAAINH